MDQSVAISFTSGRDAIKDGYVLLYQDPYAPGLGVTSTLDLVKGLSDALYDTGGISIDCGINDDWSFSTGLYAYPSSPALSFEVGITHGTISEGQISYITVREMVQFKLSSIGTLKFPVISISSISWYGDVYDRDGRRIVGPSLAANGRELTAPTGLYGTALITYRVYRVLYGVNIPPREDSVENVYQSMAYARWNGGVEMLKIDPPEGAESDYAQNANCGWRTIVNIIPPDDPAGTPTIPQENTEIFIDYCSQTKIS